MMYITWKRIMVSSSFHYSLSLQMEKIRIILFYKNYFDDFKVIYSYCLMCSIKKQKTPKTEIENAERIIKDYFDKKERRKMKDNSNIKTFEEHLEERFGEIESEKRIQFKTP